SSLEINPIINSTPNPSSNSSNGVHNWHNKPLGKIAIGVIVLVLGVISVWVINHYIGLNL
ncbi:hypothetical protein JYT26_02625, partial [Beggiatoa alba]|nr:hypothetical protein [Beggiatoa alba]